MDKALAFEGEGGDTSVTWGNIEGKPETYPPESHTHDMIHVIGLEDELSSMQSAIANKANSSHTHSISNITNLQNTLNGKADTSHTHAIADVTNLQTTLNGKAASSHNHSASNITSGTIPVARGGTGRSTLTSGYFLRGNGTGAVTLSSVDDVKEALGISSGGGSYDIGSSGVGTIVKWANKNWIICHTENGLIYLAGLFFVSTSQQFDSGDSVAYAGSDLAQACVTYQNTIPSDSLALAVNTTVNGVTNKIFVASYEQMNGGFMLFYSNDQREFMNTIYWTSSSATSLGVWYINIGGYFDSIRPVNKYGFRPFVALRL